MIPLFWFPCCPNCTIIRWYCRWGRVCPVECSSFLCVWIFMQSSNWDNTNFLDKWVPQSTPPSFWSCVQSVCCCSCKDIIWTRDLKRDVEPDIEWFFFQCAMFLSADTTCLFVVDTTCLLAWLTWRVCLCSWCRVGVVYCGIDSLLVVVIVSVRVEVHVPNNDACRPVLWSMSRHVWVRLRVVSHG